VKEWFVGAAIGAYCEQRSLRVNTMLVREIRSLTEVRARKASWIKELA